MNPKHEFTTARFPSRLRLPQNLWQMMLALCAVTVIAAVQS
jgi:hypothetical protein